MPADARDSGVPRDSSGCRHVPCCVRPRVWFLLRALRCGRCVATWPVVMTSGGRSPAPQQVTSSWRPPVAAEPLSSTLCTDPGPGLCLGTGTPSCMALRPTGPSPLSGSEARTFVPDGVCSLGVCQPRTPLLSGVWLAGTLPCPGLGSAVPWAPSATSQEDREEHGTPTHRGRVRSPASVPAGVSTSDSKLTELSCFTVTPSRATGCRGDDREQVRRHLGKGRKAVTDGRPGAARTLGPILDPR